MNALYFRKGCMEEYFHMYISYCLKKLSVEVTGYKFITYIFFFFIYGSLVGPKLALSTIRL